MYINSNIVTMYYLFRLEKEYTTLKCKDQEGQVELRVSSFIICIPYF